MEISEVCDMVYKSNKASSGNREPYPNGTTARYAERSLSSDVEQFSMKSFLTDDARISAYISKQSLSVLDLFLPVFLMDFFAFAFVSLAFMTVIRFGAKFP